MKRFIRHQLMILGAVAFFAACSSSEDDAKDGKSSNPNPPSGEAVPSSFRNTATSQSDLESKVSSVQSDIVNDAKSELGMSGASLYMPFMKGFLAQSSNQDTDIGFDGLDSSFSAGDDCRSLYEFTEQADQYITSMFSALRSSAPIEDDFAIDEEAAAQAGYTVTQVDDDDYAWRVKLEPSDDNSSFFATAMEMALGATDTEVASLFKSDLSFDSADFNQQGSSSSSSEDVKFSTIQEVTMYANIETMSATVGVNMDMMSEGQGAESDADLTMVSDMAITAGDNATIVQNMDVSGTSGGESVDGFAKVTVSKVSDDSYSFVWTGNQGGKSFDEEVIVTGNATSCTVKSAKSGASDE